MNEKPILFNSAMVRAILEGKKTVTRRVVKPQPEQLADGWHVATKPASGYGSEKVMREFLPIYCPYGQAGDRLWVRETWAHDAPDLDTCRRGIESDGIFCGPYYKATAPDFDQTSLRWRPSIFMPRWASRITLEVTGVRVERVQDITSRDACAEGIPGCRDELSNVHAVAWFQALWDQINAKRGFGWSVNPWVWVVEFKRI